MNRKRKNEINAFYEMYKAEKEGKMIYKFKCENASCAKIFNVEIAIKDYDKYKNRQTCPVCNAKMKRVIEWEGIATGSGDGWHGKSDGGNAI